MAKEKIILTGDRPTGRLHIGHYVGSLRRRVELQNSGLYDKIFIFIADAQALTDNMENPEKVRQNVKFLNEIMQETLEPIRNRRKEFEKDIPAIYDMLKKGCETARETAAATLDDVRKAMKINYFDDAELIAEQVKKFGGE